LNVEHDDGEVVFGFEAAGLAVETVDEVAQGVVAGVGDGPVIQAGVGPVGQPVALALEEHGRAGLRAVGRKSRGEEGVEVAVHGAPVDGQNGLAGPDHQFGQRRHERGRGVASGFWFNVGLKSSVSASVNPDGTVSLTEGSTDIGGTRASLAMQLAETLGITAEEVKPQVVDTDSVGYNDVTGGSRTTFASGYAAYEAGQDIIRQLKERAAKIWEVEPDTVSYEGGVLKTSADAEKSMTFKEIAGRVMRDSGRGGSIVNISSIAGRGTAPFGGW